MLTRTEEENILIHLGDVPSNIFKYIIWNENYVERIWNVRQIPSVISKFCGRYCIFYFLYRGRGLHVRKIGGMFTIDSGLNYSIVHNFVYKF